MKHHRYLVWFLALAAVITLQACGKSSSSNTVPTGSMAVSVTDAPGDFDHVWITVKDIWVHTSDAAGPNEAGWLKYPLGSYKTVDLLTLANGNAQSIWDNITLPVGNYHQIRLVLVDTDDFLAASAATAGLTYNNEVILNGVEYPLHIPDAQHGIRLVPLVGAFKVMEGGTLRLAIDFDAGHDIVDFRTGEYILKPRLAYFDLDHAGAIVGKLSTGATFTTAPRFVIKAERLVSGGTNTYHVVRRWTIPRPDGTFILYPVSTLVTSTWDVVVRGLDYQTVIIKGVPITNGATPTNGLATNLGTIAMTAASTQDYSVDGTITSPTGAWVQFYQTLPGAGEYPYEVRFRHFNPLLGRFLGFRLSSDPVQVGTYSTGTISLTTTTPEGGNGAFDAVADAVLYDRSAPQPVTSATTTVAFNSSLTVQSPYQGNSVSGSITMANPTKMNSKMDDGILFAVHGGMIVNAISTVMGTMPASDISTGGTYTLTNLPGGTTTNPLPGAFYGIEAVGWSSTPMPMSTSFYKAVAIPQIVDLRTGSDTADMLMVPLW